MYSENKNAVINRYNSIISQKNEKTDFYNGFFDRFKNPVLTREHIPPTWKYDFDEKTNPFFMERLGVNAVFNSGAIYLNGKYYLVARVEGNDRKSFFAVAESESPIEGFKFWDYPVVLPDICPEETNVYDMRLTAHEDGWIYGVFCSESKEKENPDLSAAAAQAGIVRTRDLKTWERLPNLITKSKYQRNCVLHPEFIDGKYAFYTRPQDDFIDAGDGGGICLGKSPALMIEELADCRRYGSNFLLNVGPLPDGSIRDIDKAYLGIIGNWMNYFGEAVYATVPTGILIDKKDKDFILKGKDAYYLFCFDLPMVSDSNVALFEEGFYEDSFEFSKTIKSVTWLDNGKQLNFLQNSSRVTIETEPYVYGRNLVVRVAKIVCAG